MEPDSIVLIILSSILTIMTLFWLVAGWMRLRRYAHAFQLVEYDQKRYGQWYWRDRGERLYLGVGMGCLGLLFTAAMSMLLTDLLFLFFAWFLLLAITLIPTGTLILLTLSSAILSMIALALAPRERDIKASLIFTPRTVRLLVTAGVIAMLPMLLALWSLGVLYRPIGVINNPANYSRTNFVLWVLLCLFTGPVTYLLTPLVVAVANVLNWPINSLKRGADS
jgi:hypothetical protein